MRMGRMPPSSSTDEAGRPRAKRSVGPGDPDCPICGGVGWLRHDVPVGHADFGQAYPCECIADRVSERRLAALRQESQQASLGDMLFETFNVNAPGNSPEARRSLAKALEAAQAYARDPEGWLVLRGSYGCGKTHLAAAIANERMQRGSSALFVVVPDLLDQLRAGYGGDGDLGFESRFEAVRNAPMLILDDLGTQAPTAWAAEKLFQILNYRYNAKLPTVVTTNRELEELDERLRSRLGHWGVVRVVEIKALDYRGGVHPDRAELSSLQMYSDMTFQTWDPRTATLRPDLAENLARGFALARSFADDPTGWLVLTGEHGCGKTHLAAAIANHRVAIGASALFVVVPDLLDHLRATFSPTSRVTYDKRFEEVRSASLLVLDDLGTESATTWAQEKLFQILNHRYAARKPTAITMATPLKDVSPRIRSRMLDVRRCTVFEILAGLYHGPAQDPRG